MSIFKCKMCGGDLEITDGQTVCECEYCGTKQTVPALDDEKKAQLFKRANRLRFNCEFDKAAGVYENIVSEFPEEPEAYWGMILCKYGIEYVDDPATAKKIPTCHRSSFDSIFDDESFEIVMEYSDTLSKSVYREEAKAIEEIRKGIVEISSKEEPYDIFICYKETDETGNRTIDSVIAQDVYEALTEKGYKVFFSRITLEDKLGVEYEPYIFAALNSAKVMLAFGTKYEYYDAVWVKNEWSRFLRIIANDHSRYLIPCFKDIDAYDMPKEFAKLQSQDMGKVGSIQDLIRGIEKIIPLGRAEKETVFIKENQVSSAVEPLLERISIFLEDGKWNDANIYCEKVLDIDPKNAEAYLGKLMAELQVKNRKQLADCAEPFDNKENFAKVIRFGDEALEKEIRGYIECIKDRNETARKQGIYDNAQGIMRNAKSESEFKSAASVFGTIAGFKDADELKEQCLDKAQAEKIKEEQIIEQRNKMVEAVRQAFEKKTGEDPQKKKSALHIKLDELSELLLTFDLKKSNLEAAENEYIAIKDEIDDLQKSRSSLGLFAGSKKKEIDLKVAELTDRAKKYVSKIEKLEAEFNGYTSKSSVEAEISSVNKQLEVIKSQIKASMDLDVPELTFKQAFETLKDPIINSLFKTKYFNLYSKILSSFTFGTYAQSKEGNAKTPIEWQVLEIKDGKALIISKKALDCVQYNGKNAAVTWENCTLRTWLNGTFYKAAFSSEEQKMIQSTKVTADANPDYDTDPGNDTTDKVFLLSITEVNKYFSSDNDMICKPTDYAVANGAFASDSTGSCWWWLRSPGSNSDRAADVRSRGGVGYGGYDVDDDDGCVRPALWIEI